MKEKFIQLLKSTNRPGIENLIDFLDRKKPILVTQQDEPIKPSIYALNMNINSLRGRLYYIINNEEILVESGKKIFGAFKLKYYLSENDFRNLENINERMIEAASDGDKE